MSWWLPVPGVLVHALVLLFSRRVWTTLVETSSRTGRSGTVIDAHRHLILLGVAVVGYAAISLTDEGTWGSGRGMSPATPEQAAVVRVMLRGLCLVIVYASAFVLLRTYVFD